MAGSLDGDDARMATTSVPCRRVWTATSSDWMGQLSCDALLADSFLLLTTIESEELLEMPGGSECWSIVDAGWSGLCQHGSCVIIEAKASSLYADTGTGRR